eukprot:Gb_20165 [translate_table: standard]
MPTVVCYCSGEAPGVLGSLQNYSSIHYNPLGLKPNGKSKVGAGRAKTFFTIASPYGSNRNTGSYSSHQNCNPYYLLFKPNRLFWHKKLRATLSSFAEEEDLDRQCTDKIGPQNDEEHRHGADNDNRVVLEGNKNGGMQGMAEAFNISARTAYGITAGIALAAFIFPAFMQSVTIASPLKFKVLSYLTMLCGFYMAWNIGANDVANAMGTSVGSGALTIRQAVVTAAFLEFSGALLVGSHVTHTMQKGILIPGTFNGRDALQFSGLLSSLAAAGTWLQVASYYGLPVSTTHCIIGAMVGFGLVYGGVHSVYWSSLARVVSSWVISPLIGAAVSFLVYNCIRRVLPIGVYSPTLSLCCVCLKRFVYSAPSPGRAAAKAAPIAVFIGVTAFSFTCFPNNWSPVLSFLAAPASGTLGAVLMHFTIQRQLGDLLGEYCEIPAAGNPAEKDRGPFNFLAKVGGPSGTQLRVVYGVFGYLQVLSACFMSFAHGANDVANAIGPISSALAILQGVSLKGEGALPIDVLAWGGFGIVAGLLVWGYRVIATIGKKITELTPTRGFAAEFAAATVVVMASRLGMPISATHTLVGAVMGVGFARDLKSVHGDTVKEIVASWLVTIPVGALLCVVYTFILSRFLPALW